MDDSKIVAEADALYKSGEGEKLYALLVAYKDSHNADILWRLARATCDLAKESKDQKRRAELMNEAFDYVSRALTADPNNYACHKVRCEGWGGWMTEGWGGWMTVDVGYGDEDGSGSYIEHIHFSLIGRKNKVLLLQCVRVGARHSQIQSLCLHLIGWEWVNGSYQRLGAASITNIL